MKTDDHQITFARARRHARRVGGARLEHGVHLPDLAPHDHLIVRTRNSTYEIIVLVPHTASVMVRGGAFFPTFTPARVAGSSLGGGFLKMHGVYAGFQLA